MATKRKWRRFTPKFKAKVVLGALRRESSQAEVCRRHTFSDEQLSQWKHQLVENAASVLVSSTDKQSSEATEQIAHLDQQVSCQTARSLQGVRPMDMLNDLFALSRRKKFTATPMRTSTKREFPALGISFHRCITRNAPLGVRKPFDTYEISTKTLVLTLRNFVLN